MTIIRNSVVLRLTLLATLLLTGCQLSPQNVLPDRLKLGGSTTVEPAAQLATGAFMTRFPNTEVTVRGGGSSIGVKGLVHGAFHIGMISRSLSQAELEMWPDLKATVIGRDGVLVVVNHALYEAGVTQLTLEQVAGIWLGEITNWQTVGGPDLPILVYDRALGGGTRGTFAEIVLGAEDAPAPGAIAALDSNELVVSAVSQELGAVSMLSAGWQTNDVIGVAIVTPAGEVVAPMSENIASGRYPILRDLNLITNGPPQGLAAQFIAFMLSDEGQGFVEAAGYNRVK